VVVGDLAKELEGEVLIGEVEGGAVFKEGEVEGALSVEGSEL
jgi:hypothetical protein